MLSTEVDAFRVRYAPISVANTPYSEMPERAITLTGLEMVIPPEGEMTADELDRWEFDMGARRGFTQVFETIPSSAALVEAHRTIENLIPKGSVK